ncbi:MULTISPECIES: hypothetical protein [unclassified Rhizobium]|uniref:hypothetical protein n=1 Tax=unclassified Rhizobium TaxID=2613769 RepID=UPI00287F7325|nr:MULTISPECIES: hypothetical protein [unclassified Rhizobium]
MTGLGDLTLMCIFILPKKGELTFGVGPLIVLPTATDDFLGGGMLQVGAAGVAVAPRVGDCSAASPPTRRPLRERART